MPSILSSFMVKRKQEESCGWQVPALKRVGEAWVNHFSERRLYVSKMEGMSFPWIPIDTRISMCCGRSATR